MAKWLKSGCAEWAMSPGPRGCPTTAPRAVSNYPGPDSRTRTRTPGCIGALIVEMDVAKVGELEDAEKDVGRNGQGGGTPAPGRRRLAACPRHADGLGPGPRPIARPGREGEPVRAPMGPHNRGADPGRLGSPGGVLPNESPGSRGAVRGQVPNGHHRDGDLCCDPQLGKANPGKSLRSPKSVEALEGDHALRRLLATLRLSTACSAASCLDRPL